MRDIVQALVDNQYEIVIEAYNQKRGSIFPIINSALYNPIDNNVYINYTFDGHTGDTLERISTFRQYMFGLLRCPVLQPKQKFGYSSYSKQTYKYRKGLLSLEQWNNESTFQGIFKEYIIERGERFFDKLRISYIYRDLSTHTHERCHYITHAVLSNDPIPLHGMNYFDKVIKYKESDNNAVETLTNELMNVKKFHFIESYEILSDLLVFNIKPFKMFLGYINDEQCYLTMPGLKVACKASQRQWFIKDHVNYMHPHVSSSGGICLGNFQDYVNNNRYHLSAILVNIYELLCIYNTGSPYWRPYAYYSSCIRNATGDNTIGFDPGVFVGDIFIHRDALADDVADYLNDDLDSDHENYRLISLMT